MGQGKVEPKRIKQRGKAKPKQRAKPKRMQLLSPPWCVARGVCMEYVIGLWL